MALELEQARNRPGDLFRLELLDMLVAFETAAMETIDAQRAVIVQQGTRMLVLEEILRGEGIVTETAWQAAAQRLRAEREPPPALTGEPAGPATPLSG